MRASAYLQGIVDLDFYGSKYVGDRVVITTLGNTSTSYVKVATRSSVYLQF